MAIRSKGALVALVTFLLPAPAATAALIVPGRSVGKVKLRQTRPEVQRELGRPTSKSGTRVDGIKWVYAHRHLVIWFGDSDNATGKISKYEYVEDIYDYNRRDHTAKGIRIGSKMSRVRRAYPNLHCWGKTDSPCLLARRIRGDELYDFTFLDEYAGPKVDYFELGTDTCCYSNH